MSRYRWIWSILNESGARRQASLSPVEFAKHTVDGTVEGGGIDLTQFR
jgi:hypothetical protein